MESPSLHGIEFRFGPGTVRKSRSQCPGDEPCGTESVKAGLLKKGARNTVEYMAGCSVVANRSQDEKAERLIQQQPTVTGHHPSCVPKHDSWHRFHSATVAISPADAGSGVASVDSDQTLVNPHLLISRPKQR